MLWLLPLALATPPTRLYDLGFVLRGEGPFAAGVGAPSVEWDGASETYVLWFESPAPAEEVPEGCANSYRIGRATSTDGVRWTVDEAPAFGPSDTPGSARYCSVSQPAALFDGVEWHLFWSASRVPNENATTNAPSGIGWATSPDGRSWTVQEEQLVPFEDASVGMASAVALDGRLYLAYAHDPDLELLSRPVGGGAWTAPALAVDHSAVGDWASEWVHGPSLACDADAASPLGMLFGGDTTGTFTRSLAWAGSTDGGTWTVDPAGPLEEASLVYQSVNHWDLLRADAGWRVWYSGTDPDSGLKAIGVAVTDVRLGPPSPRACPDPWAPLDTGDTGEADTGEADTGEADCDCPPAGCGCSSGGGAPWAALPLALGALARRGRAGNRERPQARPTAQG